MLTFYFQYKHKWDTNQQWSDTTDLNSIFRLCFVWRMYQATALCLQASYTEKYEYASAVIKKKVRFHGKLINEAVVVNFIVCDVIKSYGDTRNGKVVKLSNISQGTCVNLSRALSLCSLK